MKKNELTEEEINKLEIDILLFAIYRISGYDFRQYARSSVKRRIMHRMRLESLPSISALTEKVIHEPDFLEVVLNDLSINVTEMFRDPSFFLAFREKVVPHLKTYPEIRIWHAGCSSGEEAYSMAILLEEEGLYNRTRIYATDMNARVLRQAEAGAFSLNKMQTYTKNYFQAGGKREFSQYYTTDSVNAYFHPSLTENMVFAQHNLVTDSSFNEFHVIICRNVMIYFNHDLQKKVFHLFDESLSSRGFLGLGHKETLRTMDTEGKYILFSREEKIYQKKG
ncbi:CheR family methyltransferase [Heyndrickxia acidiproducens]|uniref:CheR family methyltransferase n=1 Tax=Heyndrickxia acidiproducens TaxID=1121084 RepID=UPI00038040C7|nr:protein-glutamate O-methyltransferase CheR [Heyndrickxia acidiproducens]